MKKINETTCLGIALLLSLLVFSCGQTEGVDSSEIEAPTQLSGVANGYSITLTWIDNANNEDGYILERKKSTDISYSIIASGLAENAQVYSDTVSEDATYLYRVKAFKNPGIMSYYSNSAMVIVGEGGTSTYNKEEKSVAQIRVIVDIDGEDDLYIKDGKLRIHHITGALPLDPTVTVSLQVGTEWAQYSTGTWTLAWAYQDSNEFDMGIPGLAPDGVLDRVTNLQIIRKHCYTSGSTLYCGNVYLRNNNNDTSRIFFDDTFNEPPTSYRGIYEITFEYEFTKAVASTSNVKLGLAKIDLGITVAKVDTLVVEDGTMKIIHDSVANSLPSIRSLAISQYVGGNWVALSGLPAWTLQFVSGLTSEAYTIPLPGLITTEYDGIGRILDTDLPEDIYDHMGIITKLDEHNIVFDDTILSSSHDYFVSFEYFYLYPEL